MEGRLPKLVSLRETLSHSNQQQSSSFKGYDHGTRSHQTSESD
jgi:hypothetical protein